APSLPNELESHKHAKEPTGGPNKRSHVSGTPQDISIDEDMPELHNLHIIHEDEEEEEEGEEEEGEEEEEEEDQLLKYERMRKMGDDDRELKQAKRKHAPRGKDARTEDIRAVFNKETRVINGGESS
ncbi:hypothetical protein DXG01_015150, partial [Tephrocybe rancida]